MVRDNPADAPRHGRILPDLNLKTYPGDIPDHLHANCFITRPMDQDRFIEVVRSVEDFGWPP